MIRIEKFLLIIAFGLCAEAIYAQTPVVDSLKRVEKRAKGETKLEIKNKIIEEYLNLSEEAENPEQYLKLAAAASQVLFKEASSKNSAFYKGKSLQFLGSINSARGNSDETIRYYRQAKTLLLEADSVENAFFVQAKIGKLYLDMGNADQAIQEMRFALTLAGDKKIADRPLAYFYISQAFYRKGAIDSAISYAKILKKYAQELSDTTYIARAVGALGNFYYFKGDYSSALQNNLESLRISEIQQDTARIAFTLLNIGNIYKDMRLFAQSHENYKKALKIYTAVGDIKRMALIYNNIGIVYQKEGKFKEAEKFYLQSKHIRDSINDEKELLSTLINLGSLYNDLKQYSRALVNFNQAVRMATKQNDKNALAVSTLNMAHAYEKTGNFPESIRLYRSSLAIATQIEAKEFMKENYLGLSSSYEKQNDYKTALHYFKYYFNMHDTLLNESNQKAIAEMQTKYDTDKKEQAINLLNKEKELQDIRIKRDTLVKFAMAFGILLVLIFSGFVLKQLRVIKKKNIELAHKNDEIQQQKEEIETQRDEIMNQRDLLSKQKQEITDSIFYARRIQRAVLPAQEVLSERLQENFILFKPRDIVSGDFYWFTNKGNKTIIVDADCTGHGVPGAFMSMLGVSFLNEIISGENINLASDILDELRIYVKRTLDQKGKKDEAKDGMDIAVCLIDWDTNKMQFAGAYNPLLRFRNGELLEIKADKMPIGIHMKEDLPFTNHELDLEKGDTFYIFSDGYVSQFGGDSGRKFMSKAFKILLEEINHKPMDEQLAILDKALSDWQGEFDQVDDISVIGFRI